MAKEEQVVWLTKPAFERLQEELEYLKGPWRIEIAHRIDEARSEGDLRENGGYHAAKDEQGKQEGRIRELEALLEHAVVGEAPTDSSNVGLGTVVTATVAGRTQVFLLGNREIAGDSDIKVISETSPLGAAVMGLAAGESAKYLAPTGRELTVKVDKVEPYQG